MKKSYLLLLLLLVSVNLWSQQFQWAHSYAVPNCNEVAAAVADTNGQVYICGVYEASPFLPYTGDAYILKTDHQGNTLWTEYFSGILQLADIIYTEGGVVLVGQSNGPFVYQEETYGPAGYFMFLFKVNEYGDPLWQVFDEDYYAVNASLKAGKQGAMALFARGSGNVGDWILILDEAGEVVDSRLLSSTASMIVDMAFYDNRVYLSGIFFGPGSIVIDTVFIQQPPLENATFVLALNDELVAEWAHVDTAINNHDGKIVANNTGIYAYVTVINPPFTIVNVLKKFSPEGELTGEVEIPLFSSAVAHYPDMAISSDQVALFINNDFGFDSHKLLLYDFNLGLQEELLVNGPSDLYSGQVCSFEENFFIAHVYSGELNLNEELILPYAGEGKQAYLARFGEPVISGLSPHPTSDVTIQLFPNPADQQLKVSCSVLNGQPFRLSIWNAAGELKNTTFLTKGQTHIDVSGWPPGLYLATCTGPGMAGERVKIVIR